MDLDEFEHPASIDVETFEHTLSQYSSLLSDKLEALDEKRYNVIPAALAERRASKHMYLAKDQVLDLVTWKLSHGTFRPSLTALVKSNDPEQIEQTTAAAFGILPNDLHQFLTDFYDQNPAQYGAKGAQLPQDISKSLTKLCELRGIGPATASLLLSVFEPRYLPFFSDEVYRWLRYDEPEDTPGKGTRWARTIKYTAKEYACVLRLAHDLQARLLSLGRKASADEIERVAYVLGKRERRVKGDAQTLSASDDKTASDDQVGDKRPVAKRKSRSAKSSVNDTSVDAAESQEVDTRPEMTDAQPALKRRRHK